jgi:hypothetical protein
MDKFLAFMMRIVIFFPGTIIILIMLAVLL